MRYFADTFADSSYVHPSETDGTTDGVSAKVSALTECRGGETIYLLYFILREAKNTSSLFYLIFFVVLHFMESCFLLFWGIKIGKLRFHTFSSRSNAILPI